MKLSVIMGVLHMMIGIICKGTNAIFFRRWVVLFTEVLAGSVILLGLFGWMDFLIYAKWFKTLNVEDRTILNHDELNDTLNQDEPATPIFKGDWQNEHTPSIVMILINTVFMFGNVPES